MADATGGRSGTALASLLNLLQTLAIIAGIVFGVAELSNYRSQRSRQASVELANSIQTPEVFRALATVLDIPADSSISELQSHILPHRPEILYLAQTFETIGILVFQGDLDIRLVDDYFGSAIVVSWERLGPWFRQERARLEQPHFAEWYQWIAERLVDYRAKNEPLPAYEAYGGWVPPP